MQIKVAIVEDDIAFGSLLKTLLVLSAAADVVACYLSAREALDHLPQTKAHVVLISGARLTHEDLVDNLWVNSAEIAGNGIDDDGNGYVDDVHGINVIAHSGDPSDDFGHGTHVAGIIGARGNNGKGIAGVAWQVKLMILKFIDNQGVGSTSDAIECLNYARAKGAHIVNASWGNSYYEQSLLDTIATLRSSGIIVVAAAGNDATDNDRILSYPACYDLDNVVSVAATTRSNTLASFSCFGYRSVALAAPGADIISSFTNSDT